MQDANLDSVNDGLAEAMASMPPPEPAVGDAAAEVETEPAEAGQPRDEHGRFTKAEAEAAEAEQARAESGDKDGGQIPSWRLRELREERDRERAEREAVIRRAEEAERRLAFYESQQRQQREAVQAPQRPDPIADPDGFAAYIEEMVTARSGSIETAVRDMRVNMTFADMHEQHGEKFEQAMKALEDARSPQIVSDIQMAVNPGKALMRWYQNEIAMKEVGGDLEGYKKKLRDEFKKDPEFRKEFMAALDAEARGNSGGRSSDNVTNLPSLNRAPGGGGRPQLGDLGGSDKEIFENLTRKRPR